MLRMDQVHVIRHKVLVEGQSARSVARQLCISAEPVQELQASSISTISSMLLGSKKVNEIGNLLSGCGFAYGQQSLRAPRKEPSASECLLARVTPRRNHRNHRRIRQRSLVALARSRESSDLGLGKAARPRECKGREVDRVPPQWSPVPRACELAAG